MITILVADDSADNADILSEFLGDAGYEILVSSNVADTLAIAAQSLPDLILMDLQMPASPDSRVLKDDAGLDATRALRGNPETGSIPVIALTGYDADARSGPIRAAGCNATAPKPYRLPALLELIESFVGSP